jgi:glycosyltransferase involved in cell wall biosynthesis
MKCSYLANFGMDPLKTNGQVTKSLHFKDMLLQLFNEVETFNSYRSNFFQIIKFLRKRNDFKFVSLGKRGLFFLIFISIFIVQPRQTIYSVVVGGWMSPFLQKWYIRFIRKFSNVNLVFLVETHGLKNELLQLRETCFYFPNYRKKTSEVEFKKTYTKLDSGAINFVFLSRLIPEKGVEVAIQTIKYLRLKGVSCTLDIYGDGKAQFRDYIINYTVSDESLKYFGPVRHDNVFCTLRKYDALLLPSTYSGECMPGVVIEALEAGVLPITSTHKYLPEIIDQIGFGFALPIQSFHIELSNLVLSGLVKKKTDLLSVEMTNAFDKNYSTEAGVSVLKGIIFD